MKGAIGNAMVMNIVITFIVLTTAFLVGSISYSKAYKVKTKIIDIIEKYEGSFSTTSGNKIISEIDEYLGSIGYRTASSASRSNCNSYARPGEKIATSVPNYDVCIIARSSGNNDGYRGDYYKVVVFMYFDFPVLGDMVKIPVTGETRTFFKPIG